MGRRNISHDLSLRLQARITNGEFRAGQFLPPERELADEYDVNRLTLRKALAELQAQGLLERRRGRGTSVSMHRQDALAGQLPAIGYLGDSATHFYKDLFIALNRAAAAQGQSIVLLQTGQPLPARLICSPYTLGDLANAPAVPGSVRVCVGGIPTLNGPIDYTIWADREHAITMAVQHLAELGHRRIALVATKDCDGAGWYASLYGTYRECLRMLRLDWHRLIGSNGDLQENEDNIAAALADPATRPTAVVCDLDWRAHAVIGAANRLGISLPGQLSIVGMNDTPWTEACRPTLTSIAFPYAFMANLALSCLAQGATSSVRRIWVDGDLIQRGSTAPPTQA
jgi:hypothetical protein